jgi:pyruvate-ferredoxin/flavodoxin oxidoreductase
MNDKKNESSSPKYPGILTATDGTGATVEAETNAAEAAGAYPITPSTNMGEGWAKAVAVGKRNVNGRKLIFFEPEGEHAAAAVTAGMAMSGLRATNFSSGQGIAYMHESLYAAVGKRLTYVLNIGARAITKHTLNVHAGHDDYHAIDDTGFFQYFAKNVQEAADLPLIAHRTAELALNPGVVAQDGFLTTHVIESAYIPERECVKEYLGDPSDTVDSPTAAQRWVFGEKRRRIPEMFDVDYPAMVGVVQNQDSYCQGVAAQRPFFFDHIADLADQAMDEYAALTGRRYARASGYRLDDAEYVIVGQGSVVCNAEAVCDYLRDTKNMKIGVINLTMFRPFPSDILTKMLKGKKAVTVLERTDQPLAVDLPIVREIRAALGKAIENGRGNGTKPYPEMESLSPADVPEIYSGAFGMGSRDIQPGELVAAAENMLDGGKNMRQFYLSIDFVRPDTNIPKLQIWQDQLLKEYPDIADLALPSVGNLNLLPEEAVTIRMHSVGGWGAITTGKNIAQTSADLFGMHIQANPKYGSEKKGQPTTFYATLSPEPLRLNCELKNVTVVLAPDPNVCRHSNPLAGIAENGVFIMQSDLSEEEFWNTLPGSVQQTIKEKKVKTFLLDGFKIASEEASDPALRYRMQGAAFMGAFFHESPLVERHGLSEEELFDGIRAQVQKKFGHLGERVVEDNVRVIRRGFDEIRVVDAEKLSIDESSIGVAPKMPAILDGTNWQDGFGNPGRFWEQVCHLYKTASDPIADPFAAISAIPAATSAIRDMTDVRFEIPEFIPENCTGCSQCWVQCPDTAIPGVVTELDQVITAAIETVSTNGQTFDKLRQIVPHVARESRRIMKGIDVKNFADVMSTAYKTVVEKLSMDPEKRAALDEEFAPVYSALAEFPLAKTAPFFDLPENQEKGTGGLLSITVNPNTCKGCNLCVEVCPDGALKTIRQDEESVEKLRRNWELWEHLPETDDRYVNISNMDEGIGVLSSLLLKKHNYTSMYGGDGACMGCGEKTVMHLVLSAVNALMYPRVAKYIEKLDGMISQLDEKARNILSSDADLDAVANGNGDKAVEIPLEESKQADVERINGLINLLKDLRWRYAEGPTGRGRSHMGMTNATGCSSVWGSTYPFNPYPFPWTNHLFQDAPSIAIGIFEGHMRKMRDGFVSVRRAELELSGEYDAEVHEPFFENFDWREFSDDEFKMCPPIFATGGDGAMFDIGFQNLSRMFASGKPIRVIILDTQVYSNTGGQACTSGYHGQVSDMAEYGRGQKGKEEQRKEMALIAMAHGKVYVHQATQAAASHLLEGVLKGLQVRCPSVFVLHSPCAPEHVIGDDAAERASKLSLESRAFPILTYNPMEGDDLCDQLSLDGNPSLEDNWPMYEITYVDDEGAEQKMELPLTIADWAATEGRFYKHFKKIRGEVDEDALVLFHEYLELSEEDRAEKTPFIYYVGPDKKLMRLTMADEIVRLGEERLEVWIRLKQLAGDDVPQTVKDAVEYELEGEFDKKAAALKQEYEAKLTELRAHYPRVVARKLAEGLVRAGDGLKTVAELLEQAQSVPGLEGIPGDILGGNGGGGAAPAVAPTDGGAVVVTAEAAVAVAEAEEEDEGLAMEPYIDSARCTTCDECTNINKKMFAYNDKKQAYVKDPRAGTFKQLVQAAEKCTVRIIHPGTPLNPKEKDLDKWVKRAEPFN